MPGIALRSLARMRYSGAVCRSTPGTGYGPFALKRRASLARSVEYVVCQHAVRGAKAHVQKSWMTAGGGNAPVNMSVVSTTPTRAFAGSLAHDVPRPPAQP